MTFNILAALATQFVLVAAPGAGAAETNAPAPLMRVGSSEKVCQLNRYTTVAAGGGSTIHWLVSTWNPYDVR